MNIFQNTRAGVQNLFLRVQWIRQSVHPVCSRPAQRSVPRPHCSARSVECRCHLDRKEIFSNHGVSIEIPVHLFCIMSLVAIKMYVTVVKRCMQMLFCILPVPFTSFYTPRTSDSCRLILKWKKQKRKVHWQIECALKLSVKTAETWNWFAVSEGLYTAEYLRSRSRCTSRLMDHRSFWSAWIDERIEKKDGRPDS